MAAEGVKSSGTFYDAIGITVISGKDLEQIKAFNYDTFGDMISGIEDFNDLRAFYDTINEMMSNGENPGDEKEDTNDEQDTETSHESGCF